MKKNRKRKKQKPHEREAKGILGRMLRMHRAVNGLSLEQLAGLIRISAPTLMRIEHGRKFDADTWMKIQRYILEDPF